MPARDPGRRGTVRVVGRAALRAASTPRATRSKALVSQPAPIEKGAWEKTWSEEHKDYYYHRQDGSDVTWTRPPDFKSDDEGRPRTATQVSVQ